ncbi:MAG: stage 0 sporulation family protein [Gemmatimonadales bacterium]
MLVGGPDLNRLVRVLGRFLRDLQKKEFVKAEELIAKHHLAMQLVDVEHLFGGERIIFYFLAEHRVDFRELVKSMAREFHTRIELRQIGVRDEAKLKADYGDCGKPVCCNTHMVVMPPVSMRMAKLQKSTLDPSKISGRCGRLKCCLRFEQDVYEEFQQQLPPVGCRVVTSKGQGRVLAHEILARRVLVEFEDGRRLPVALDEVLTRL